MAIGDGDSGRNGEKCPFCRARLMSAMLVEEERAENLPPPPQLGARGRWWPRLASGFTRLLLPYPFAPRLFTALRRWQKVKEDRGTEFSPTSLHHPAQPDGPLGPWQSWGWGWGWSGCGPFSRPHPLFLPIPNKSNARIAWGENLCFAPDKRITPGLLPAQAP